MPGLHGLRGAGSYLSMDTDGRVIRVDSFAKFLMPGELVAFWVLPSLGSPPGIASAVWTRLPSSSCQ